MLESMSSVRSRWPRLLKESGCAMRLQNQLAKLSSVPSTGDLILHSEMPMTELDQVGYTHFYFKSNKFTLGELGQVQQIQLLSRDSPLPPIAYLKTSGGLFHDCSIHDIDIMTWIVGEFPTEVWVNANAMFPEVGFTVNL
jgi:hypothetical protein